MPRVLFLTQTHAVWGGMEVWLHNLSNWLQERGWDIRFALAKGARFNKPEPYIRAHPHVKPIVMDASVGTEESRVQAIIDACKSCSPDLLVPIGVGSIFPAVERLKLAGVRTRLFIAVHSTHLDYLQNIIDYRDSIDQIVAISRLIEQYLLRKLPGEAARIGYIRHGVADPLNTRKRTRGPLRIGLIGRLCHHSKRVLDLTPLCENLRDACIPIDIHVFGDGADADDLKAELTRYNDGKVAIAFHGYVSPADLYASAYPNLDVTLIFSDREGSPLVLFEAMRHGVVPVVSRFIGHASEGLVRHEINSLTFPVGDVKTAADLISRLAADSEMLERFSQRCIEDTAADTEERMYREWEESFERACELPPRALESDRRVSMPATGHGRLEKLGLSPRAANSVRRLLGTRFPHQGGFEEWPGTQPISSAQAEDVERTLLGIDLEKMAESYESEADCLIPGMVGEKAVCRQVGELTKPND